MAKKPDLAEALRQVSGRPVALPSNTKTPPAKTRNDRLGKRTVAGHFQPGLAKALKQLALDKDVTVQALLEEAINDLLKKHS